MNNTIDNLDFSNITVESFDVYLNDYKLAISTLNDRLVSLRDEDLSWATLVQPVIDLENSLQCRSVLMEMDSFHTDEKIREKCNDVSTLISKFYIDQSMRKDLFAKYRTYYNGQFAVERLTLSDEQIRYLDKHMLDYRMAGLELDDESYEHVKELNKEMSELSNKFSLNINNENTNFMFTLNELSGLEEVGSGKWLEDRKQPDGMYKVTLKYPDYIPLMEYCKNRDTRKKISVAFMSRCATENTDICNKIFKLRNEKCRLFGFTKHSDYKLQKQMVLTTDTVVKFINSLNDKSTPLLAADMEILSKYAEDDGITNIDFFDIAYYSRIHTEKESDLNKESLKQYFSLQTVTNGMFEIYQKLLGFQFTDITDSYRHTFWHPDVKLYKVTDASDGALIGYFYLDLFPRDGKYGHAAVFPVIRRSSINCPVAFMACNFSKGDGLTFDDVETFFHEFGHIMHGMSSRTTIASLGGTACERDFVEMPSQMFEEWCYRFESLRIMAPDIPEEVIAKLNKQRNILQGLFIKRQLAFSFFDMAIHGDLFNEPCDKLFNRIYKDITGLQLDDSVSFPASFGHLLGGYDSGYYGYMWSLVFAKDCFYSAFVGHEIDPEVGKRFKDQVLSYGASRPSIDSLREFLGREPSDNAFIKSLFDTTC